MKYTCVTHTVSHGPAAASLRQNSNNLSDGILEKFGKIITQKEGLLKAGKLTVTKTLSADIKIGHGATK